MVDIITKRPSILLSKQSMTPYVFRHGEYNILVERNVFPPDLSASSLHFFDVLGDYRASCSLDMGCGTGILAIQLSHISSMTIAIDNHKSAIRNTIKNINLNNIKNIKTIHSNLYDTVACDYKFDLIAFNHPYYPSKKCTNFGIDGTGGSILINKFFIDSLNYISKETRILMPFSEFAGQENNPLTLAVKLGYSGVEVWKSEDHLGYHWIYEFKYVSDK